MDCIFCKIVNKEIPADIIYEDENTLAILDLRPVNKGHSLVLPKKHYADFISTPDEELAETTKIAKKIAKAVQQVTGAAGLNITTNNGAAAGQAIFYLHYHVIPRYAADGLKQWPHHETEPSTRAQLAEVIKKHL